MRPVVGSGGRPHDPTLEALAHAGQSNDVFATCGQPATSVLDPTAA